MFAFSDVGLRESGWRPSPRAGLFAFASVLRELLRPRLTDRHLPADDPPAKIALAALKQPCVELLEVRKAGDGDEGLRRKRPTSPSTPPFSWAPWIPGVVNSEQNR